MQGFESERWRARAEELRALAEMAKQERTRALLRQNADDFERIATRIETGGDMPAGGLAANTESEQASSE